MVSKETGTEKPIKKVSEVSTSEVPPYKARKGNAMVKSSEPLVIKKAARKKKKKSEPAQSSRYNVKDGKTTTGLWVKFGSLFKLSAHTTASCDKIRSRRFLSLLLDAYGQFIRKPC